MAVYPDIISSVPSNIPFQWSLIQQVIATKFENGVERRRLIRFGKYRVITLQYQQIQFVKVRVIYNFYNAQRGPLTSFKFFFPDVSYHFDEYAGYAESGQTTLIMPSKGGTNVILKQDGVVVSEADYIFTPYAGPDGEDRVTLAYGAPAGAKYTLDFTGVLKIKARFDEAPIVFNEIKATFSSLTIVLKQLQPVLWE